MEIVDGGIQFSANDLVNHLACRRLTELNNDVASGLGSAPSGWDPALRCCESADWLTNGPILNT